MQNALNYYNEHAKAEANGMAVDWRVVSANMAKLIAAELQAQGAANEAAADQ